MCRDALNLLKKGDAAQRAAPMSAPPPVLPHAPSSPPSPASSPHVLLPAPVSARPPYPAISVPGKPGAPVSDFI